MTKEEIKKRFIDEICSITDEDDVQIRKLTPREAFRLQGLDEDDIDKLMDSGIAVTDLYKLAGNSIVVPCLSGIFSQMFGLSSCLEYDEFEYDGEPPSIVQVGHLVESKVGRINQNAYRVYSTLGVCPTLLASMGCGGRSPLIVIKNGKCL